MKNVIAVTLALALLFFFVPTQVQAASCGSTYTVQLGDTLSGIANNCGVNYANLVAANPSIPNADLIFPGQVINIPSGNGIPNTGGSGTYTVQLGDTLSSIARRYNVTVSQLLAGNPTINNSDLIYPGQVITLPAGTPGIPNTGGNGTYTVQVGDTLSGIAQSHNTTTQAMLTANPWITNPDFILPGWVVNLP